MKTWIGEHSLSPKRQKKGETQRMKPWRCDINLEDETTDHTRKAATKGLLLSCDVTSESSKRDSGCGTAHPLWARSSRKTWGTLYRVDSCGLCLHTSHDIYATSCMFAPEVGTPWYTYRCKFSSIYLQLYLLESCLIGFFHQDDTVIAQK